MKRAVGPGIGNTSLEKTMTPTDTTTLTTLTPEELRVLGTLLDRVNTRGIREAQTLLHLASKLQKMLEEAK